ncbi:conjugal transfer protein TraN [Novosphingobium terrae]|uniref:conjugal transfer protein TraN n=1 Tax=Novosphingobium terrae TaxID=2726189 RepID=UPI001F128EDB|nr:conjugal transfer protein TraN [Novosphingobium terrae]
MRRASALICFAGVCALFATSVLEAQTVDPRAAAADVAGQLQGQLNSTVSSQATTNQVPGYTGASLSQSGYASNPSALASDGAVQATTSDTYALVTNKDRPTVDTSTLGLTSAKTVETDPTSYSGVATTTSQGSCQSVSTTTSSTTSYYDSCQIGSTEKDSTVTCNVGWKDTGSTAYQYQCHIQTIEQLATAAGQTTATPTAGVASDCTALAAATDCSMTGSSMQQGISEPPLTNPVAGGAALWRLDEEDRTYSCGSTHPVMGQQSASQQISYAGPRGTVNAWWNIAVPGTVDAGSTSTYTGSVIDDSACQSQIGSISCPTGSTLQGGMCVSTMAATLTYNCPSGWTLSGSTCTQTQHATSSVTGYSCPGNYVLSGSTCTSTQTAGVSGYTCPDGYTLDGTSCHETLTKAPVVAGYSCPEDYTLQGTTCFRSFTQPATPNYNCPTGYSLTGTSCQMTTQAAAVLSYSCAAGWTLDGDLCKQAANYAAALTYVCPSTWTLSGSTCQQSSTYGASLIYVCPDGWSVQGASCQRNTSYPPSINWSCPDGWSLNGNTCSQTTTYGANVSYWCNDGWAQNGGTCSQQASTPAGVTYGCPDGYSLDGTTCSQIATYPITWTTVNPGVGWFYTGRPNPSNPSELLMANTIYSQSCGPSVRFQAVYCGLPVMANGCVDMSSMNIAFVTFVAGNSDQCLYRPGQQANCWSGGTWNGSQCVATVSRAASVGYVCNGGQTLSGTTCYYTINQAANVVYSCNDGSQPSGDVCTVTNTRAATASYSCPSGGSFDGSQCQFSENQAATPTYNCPAGGSLSGTTCTLVTSQAAVANYSCPTGGTLDRTTCDYTNVQPAQAVYGCPSGSVLQGTMCFTTDTQLAAVTYACPSGYGLDGSTCIKQVGMAATVITACPSGYLLVGDTCTETLTVPATVHYACQTGYTLDGTTCTSVLDANIDGYSCPAGYVQNGSTCSVPATQDAAQIYTCPGGGVLSGTNCITSTTPKSTSGMTCQAPTSVCSDSDPATRSVYGTSVTHDCWDWTRTYQCATLTPTNDCGTLQAKTNCSFDHETCLDDACSVKSEIYKCTAPGEESTSQATTCSGDVYCIDGSCTQLPSPASPDLAKALTAINTMGQAKDQFNAEDLSIFDGTATGCHKPLFGLVNCCAGKVSGALSAASSAAALAGMLTGNYTFLLGMATQFLVLFMCGQDEMLLDVKDRMGLCTYVGEYCSEKALFVCTTERKTYCCFQSKLARVIQEQGKAQLGLGMGTPKEPNCSGFTVDQFAQLDLSKMDFTEVFSDFTSAVSLPNSLQTSTAIQQKVQAYYQTHASSTGN